MTNKLPTWITPESIKLGSGMKTIPIYPEPALDKVTDLDIIKAMLERAGIGCELTHDDEGRQVLDIEHDGFNHCFTAWTFAPDGKLLVVTAGY